MTHMSMEDKIKKGTPSDDWLKLNSQIATQVNEWATRHDLIAWIGPGQGEATAFFNPALLEIQINTDVAFGPKADPSLIGDFRERKTHFEYPKAAGAVFHEASHAKYTTWDLKESAKDLEPKENEAMHLLEETRMERMAVRAMPQNRAFLRACALEIVLLDAKDDAAAGMSGTRRVAHLAALSMGRVDAGVLKKKDVKKLRDMIESVIDPKDVQRLRDIWVEFQSIQNPARNLQRMYDLAKKWASTLR